MPLGSSRIGIVGGTGITQLPDFCVEREEYPLTPYGHPSGPIVIGVCAGTPVAFIERHGKNHTIPPHRVPYKANLAALKTLGVRQVLATCVVGSLKQELAPGTFVVPNQFIDLTWGRDDTSSVDQRLLHLPMAEPYCRALSQSAVSALRVEHVPVHETGTVVVIQGPRFSTAAEGRMYALWGGDIVNMTQYPECYFARELGLCYAVIASITDYNAGISEDLSMVSMGTPEFDRILTVFRRNTDLTYQALLRFLHSRHSFERCCCAEIQTRPYYES